MVYQTETQADDALVDLVNREHTGFRRLMLGGIFVLGFISVCSVIACVILYRGSQEISSRMAEFEFRAALGAQEQAGEVAALQNEVRGYIRDFWDVQRADQGRTDVTGADMMQVARDALDIGRLPFQSELLLDAASRQGAGPTDQTTPGAGGQADLAVPAAVGVTPAQRALVRGVNGVITWLRLQESFPEAPYGAPLPSRLAKAHAEFETALTAARDDRTTAGLASIGQAWITFLEVSGPGKFSPDACAKLAAAADTIAETGAQSLQAMYWSAQCKRKVGRYEEALGEYVTLVDRLAEAGALESTEGFLQLRMNAFHGLGTQLIATRSRTVGSVERALVIARDRCGTGAQASDGRMEIARKCLDEAVKLRKQLDQPYTSQAGTLENRGFTYLAEGRYEEALDNADAIASNKVVLAWNELVRAIAAAGVIEGREGDAAERRRLRERAAQSLRIATSRIGFYQIEDFAVCELEVLLEPTDFEAARKLLTDAHPGKPLPNCRG